MLEPIFLQLEDVLEGHAVQLQRHGGSAGIRDVTLLESALEQPRASFGGAWLHESLFAMAAAYLYHVTSNHPFVDGNKRVGLWCALTFLALNDVRLKVPHDALEELVLRVARSEVSKPDIADFFERAEKF
jgi:death-on-curing protein